MKKQMTDEELKKLHQKPYRQWTDEERKMESEDFQRHFHSHWIGDYTNMEVLTAVVLLKYLRRSPQRIDTSEELGRSKSIYYSRKIK